MRYRGLSVLIVQLGIHEFFLKLFFGAVSRAPALEATLKDDSKRSKSQSVFHCTLVLAARTQLDDVAFCK